MKINNTVGDLVTSKQVIQPKLDTGGAASIDGFGGGGGGSSKGARGSAELPVKTSTFVMNKIKERIHSEPEVRIDLVNKFKELIKSGEYKKDSDNIASKMIYESLDEEIL